MTVSYEAPLAMMRLALEQAARLSSLDALAAAAEALTDLVEAADTDADAGKGGES